MLVHGCADMSVYQELAQRLFRQDAKVRQVQAYFSLQRAKFEPAIGLPGRPTAEQVAGLKRFRRRVHDAAWLHAKLPLSFFRPCSRRSAHRAVRKRLLRSHLQPQSKRKQ